MAAQLVAGNEIAQKIKAEVASGLEALKKAGVSPKLTAVQAGENPASKIYVEQQRKSCEEIGIAYALDQLPETATQADILKEIERLNNDRSVTGIILQMPLPPGVDARLVQTAISPAKDVEAMHPVNMGRLISATNTVGPCTAMAAVTILKTVCPSLKGLEVVIVGHSEIVGKPVAMLLLQSLNESPTVTVCHIATKDLAFHTRRADVLFTAAGKSQAMWLRYQSALRKCKKDPSLARPARPDLSPLVKADMVKDGAVIIDIAINRIPESLDADGNPVLNDKGKPKMKTVGDVEFDQAKEKASWITPVPGGVGLVTTAILLRNVIEAAKQQNA